MTSQRLWLTRPINGYKTVRPVSFLSRSSAYHIVVNLTIMLQVSVGGHPHVGLIILILIVILPTFIAQDLIDRGRIKPS